MNQAEDVEIGLGHSRRYKFHSGALARNSTLFADMLTEANAAKLNSRARYSGVSVRWLIELTRLPDDDYPAGRLALVELTPSGDRADGNIGLIVNENGRMPRAEKVITAYETILYAFYNTEISIDDREMSAALAECYLLLLIADYLGCVRLISKPIEVALLKHGQELFRAIQDKPHAWIQLAYRIKSEIVFRECMVHLAGNWKVLQLEHAVKDRLRETPGLKALVEKYHRALQAQCKKLELTISTYYPSKLALPVEDLPIKREAYARDILVWMALSFFRHWLGQRLNMEQGRLAKDSGYALYKQLGTAGEAYMDKSVINQFHTKFPMTKKALNVLEKHLFELKDCVKELVARHAILKVNCLLDVHRFPVPYLTCTLFQREDFPWTSVVVEEPERPEKREFQRGGNDIARQNLRTTRVFQGHGVDELEEEDEEDEEGGENGGGRGGSLENELEIDEDDLGADLGSGKRARYE